MVFSKLIYTFLVAMIPAVEVKGAIPFGMALQLAPWQAYLMALSGSFFVVCFLAFFTHWFYVECKKHGFLKQFIGWIDKMVLKNKDKIHKYGPLAILHTWQYQFREPNMDRKHYCRCIEYEATGYNPVCNVWKCSCRYDHDAGKCRCDQHDFKVIRYSSFIIGIQISIMLA